MDEKEKKLKEKEKERAAKAKAAEKAKKEKEEAKAKMLKEREKKLAAKAKEKEVAKKEKEKSKAPVWVEQLNEKGLPEKVDKNKFPFEVVCTDCGSVRYVNQSGLLQVTKCKPCAKKSRRKNRLNNHKAKTLMYKAIVEDALSQGIFPESFKEKYGL